MLREGRLTCNNNQRLRETTFKVAITRKAYTPYHKGSETTSKVAVSRKALRPLEDTFHPLIVPLAAWGTIFKISACVDVSLCARVR
jgi:hypothetical protein